MQKLLEICNISIDNISFTECCKCIIEDRTQLRKCIHNCQPILFEQISKIDCDVILPMGQYPTEAILNTKIKRLKDYIGKIFPIKIYNKLKVNSTVKNKQMTTWYRRRCLVSAHGFP